MRKNILLTLLSGAAMFAPDAKGVTVHDLLKWDGWAIETCTDCHPTYFAKRKTSSSGETQFQYVSETKIALTGMFDDGCRVVFTLAKDGVEAADGNQLLLTSTTKTTNGGYNYTLYKAVLQDSGKYGYYNRTDVSWTGTITEKEDQSGYKIIFEPARTVPSIFAPGDLSAGILHEYELETYEPNGWMTTQSVYQLLYGVVERNKKYPVRIDFNEDGTMTFLNLGNIGKAVKSATLSEPLKGTYSNGTFDIPATTAVWACEIAYGGIHWASYSFGTVNSYSYSSISFNSSGVKGTYTENKSLGHSTDKNSYWVTNGGNCRTTKGRTLTVANFGGKSTNTYNTSNPYTPLFINNTVDMTEDLTLDVDFTLNECGHDGRVYANGTVTSIKNFENVEKYEIYMVAGCHSSITDHAGFTAWHSDGHTSAMKIYAKDFTDYATTFVPSDNRAEVKTAAEAPVSPADFTFNVLIPQADIEAAHGSSSADNTFYVKAYYNNGIEPTFHRMRYADKVTSIDAPLTTGDTTVSITGGYGEIIAGCNNTQLEVYTLSGTVVYAGNGGHIAVAPGIYIVRAGAQVEKVTVK